MIITEAKLHTILSLHYKLLFAKNLATLLLTYIVPSEHLPYNIIIASVYFTFNIILYATLLFFKVTTRYITTSHSHQIYTSQILLNIT